MFDINTLTKKKTPHQLCGLIGRIDLTDVAVLDKVIVSWQIVTKNVQFSTGQKNNNLT